MIEDKKMGIKIAETPEEEKWENIKERAIESIAQGKIEMEINKSIINLAEKKLKKYKNKTNTKYYTN